ncbi:MarR family winged helix-turn-helix transcriptional regulator [Brevibacillus daliensis]|uniref:MarR family winged helix-turn-helix transcriptional regulator n=1 Tax=Brevibacillus daliensis TaxID=2892995 RepID=UPI001E556393|nr:MarR family transcriptional regulator [Brevibacillus daliensis]
MTDQQGESTVVDVTQESLDLLIVLTRSYNWVTLHVNKFLRQYGLNPTEFGVLEVLYHKGGMPLQQIGEKILISSGNITYVIDKLEKRGLLLRKPCKADRRVIYAELTEEGHKLIAEIFPLQHQNLEESLQGLTLEEKRQIIPLLKKLGKSAQALKK